MKNTVTILFLFTITFIIQSCVSYGGGTTYRTPTKEEKTIFKEDENIDSYILTTKNEKINIASHREIRYGRGKVSYCKSIAVGRVLENDKAITYTPSLDRKNISISKISKIVDGDNLYLPYTEKGKKKRIYRLIAKTDDYILGHYIYQIESTYIGTTASKNTYRTKRGQYVVLLDSKNNFIKKIIITDKNNELVPKKIKEVKSLLKKFDPCLVNIDNLFEPNKVKNIHIAWKSKKASEKYKNEKKQKEKIFLQSTNQLDCTSQ